MSWLQEVLSTKTSFLCPVLGHKWNLISNIHMSKGPRGKGTLFWYECTRCKEMRLDWDAEINLGKTKIEIAPLMPAPSRIRKGGSDGAKAKPQNKKVSNAA